MSIKHIIPLFILLTSMLSACGGGSSSEGGGISGTGITMGRITQFGSMYVNGVRFNVDNAQFVRDGVTATGQQEYSLGEYITIIGTIDSATKTGVAEKVIFKDAVEGSVTQVSADNINIQVLGQQVSTNSLTNLHGFGKIADLNAGNIIEVSGIKDANGVVNATSIKLKKDRFVEGVSSSEIKGIIVSLNSTEKTFMINSILIQYANAQLEGFNGSLKNGQFVEVKSRSDIVGNTLVASKVEHENESPQLGTSGGEFEVEGIVTRFVSITDFTVNTIPVTTNTNTRYEGGSAANIRLNALIEIDGKIDQDGVLVARKIEFEHESSSESDGEHSEQNNEQE